MDRCRPKAHSRRVQHRRVRFVVAALAGLLVVTLLPAGSAASEATVMRFKTDGYAFAFFGNCPDVDPLPPGTVCRDAQLAVFREGVAIGGGTVAPPKTPWFVTVFQYTVEIEPNGDAVLTDERFGFRFLDPTAVTYDREHLAFASLQTQIPMTDGTTVDVDFRWQAISTRLVFGNDGPSLGDFGRVRKFVDKCSTQVNQGHQKFRVAAMTGTFDGAAVQSYESSPSAFISFNHFVFIDVEHGGCTP
jgi:hypothetical protein